MAGEEIKLALLKPFSYLQREMQKIEHLNIANAAQQCYFGETRTL